jgi:hypothetical protein
MTLPESPAVQDMDRLREVASRAAATWALRYPIPAWQLAEGVQAEQLAARWGTQVADAVLGAVLPVHREMVLAEVAHELGRRATTVPWSDPTLKRGIQYAASVVSVLALDSAASPSLPPPGSPPADERATAGETGMELQDDGGYEPFVAGEGWMEVSWAEASAIAAKQLLRMEARRAALADREAAAFPGETGPDWLTDELIDAGADALKVAANRDGDPGWTAETCSAGHLDCVDVPASQIVGSPRAIAAAVLRSVVQYADAPTLAVSAPLAAAAVPGTGGDPQSSLEPAAPPITNTPVSLQVELRTEHTRPYPTADAYEAACAALERHRQRADAAEAERATLRERLGRALDLDPTATPEPLEMVDMLVEQTWKLGAERDTLRGHILDIDAHATPYGDVPDEPGWVGTYLVTAGALHRALGRIGHTAPKCAAEAELTKALEELDLTRQGGDAIQELRRAAEAQVLRLAETIRRYEPVIEAAKAWRVWLADELDNDTAETNLAVAVGALGDIPSPTAPEAAPVEPEGTPDAGA